MSTYDELYKQYVVPAIEAAAKVTNIYLELRMRYAKQVYKSFINRRRWIRKVSQK